LPRGQTVAPPRDARGQWISGPRPWQAKPKTTKVCPTCGSEFQVRPCEMRVVHCSISCSKKGKPSGRLGMTASPETREKQRQAQLGKGGPTHWNWKHGKRRDRNNAASIAWRNSVYKRDDYTCLNCGVRGGDVQAHHVTPFSESPELRYEVDNGVTLCIRCHQAVHGRRFYPFTTRGGGSDF
jgi:hypothetical protein